MQEDQLWLLVSLQLSGEATPEELAELEHYIQDHPQWQERIDAIRLIWNNKRAVSNSGRDGAFDRHLQRLSNYFSEPALLYESAPETDTDAHSVEPRSGIRLLSRWLWPLSSAAAVILMIFIFGEKDRMRSPDQQSGLSAVITKPGSRSKIQLPDGSQVWLNGDSKITYDEAFFHTGREVRLSGEAYFDIAKDKSHPFVIHTNSIDIKVLGTSLNVRSYQNELQTETILIRGSVEVFLRHSPEHSIILRPNDKLIVKNDKIPLEKNSGLHGPASTEDEEPLMVLSKPHQDPKDSTVTEVLWTKNKLAFDKEPLEIVAQQISRWYDVKVCFKDENLKHGEYSGVFDNESLQQVMEALRLSGNFHYTISKNEIIIKP